MEFSRHKLQKPLHLKEFLEKALKGICANIDSESYKLWEVWDSAVGNAIARNAQPEAINQGVLLVHVIGSPWMNHLQFMKQEIIDKLNAALGKQIVFDIRFRIGQF